MCPKHYQFFLHSILAWNQEICTIPMIFRHCMLFLVFFLNVRAHACDQDFFDKDASIFKFFRAYGIRFDSGT